MTGMLRIIMNASGFYHFGVCSGADIQAQDVKSIIVVLLPEKEEPLKTLKKICLGLRNAFGDYDFIPHTERLPVDGPLAASASGLGVISKSGNLVSPIYGANCPVGMITSTLELPVTGRQAFYCADFDGCRGEGEWCADCAFDLLHPAEENSDQ